jgi:hypothetical protein
MTEKKPNKFDYFTEESQGLAGFEKITNDTMSIPFLRYAQDGSPQLKKTKPEYIEGLKPGQYFNSVTKKIHGDKARVIVLGFDHVYTEWKPNRGGFVSIHDVGNAQKLAVNPQDFKGWETSEGNELNETYMYYVLIEGHEGEGIAVLSLSSSNIGPAKAWNRQMMTTMMPDGRKAMPHWITWDLSTMIASNDQGEWYKVKIDFAGFITKAQYQKVLPERETIPATNQIEFKEETAQENETPQNSNDATPF